MKRIFELIFKNQYFLVFLLLQFVAFMFLFNYNTFQRISLLSSSNGMVGRMTTMSSDSKDYFHLKKLNEALRTENASLKQKLNDFQLLDTVATDSIEVVVDSVLVQYGYTSAKVVNNSTRYNANFITVNKGTEDGIQPEMAVIGPDGVIGRVIACSNHFSSIMSVVNQKYFLNVRFKGQKQFGTLNWDGEDYRYAQLHSISKHAQVHLGDTVVSNSFDARFPPNIMVGTVSDFEVNPADQFYRIELELSTDFSALSTVYIIENKLKEEQKQLEASVSE